MLQIILIGAMLTHQKPETSAFIASVEADKQRPTPRKIDRGW
jgi:hypothetical protein